MCVFVCVCICVVLYISIIIFINTPSHVLFFLILADQDITYTHTHIHLHIHPNSLFTFMIFCRYFTPHISHNIFPFMIHIHISRDLYLQCTELDDYISSAPFPIFCFSLSFFITPFNG